MTRPGIPLVAAVIATGALLTGVLIARASMARAADPPGQPRPAAPTKPRNSMQKNNSPKQGGPAGQQGAGQQPIVDANGDPIPTTLEGWQQRLTPEQFQVTRLKGTERAFTGKYWNTKTKGTYRCICCGEPLFRSDEKFDSGCGWPSFNAPIDAKQGNVKGQVVAEHDDFSRSPAASAAPTWATCSTTARRRPACATASIPPRSCSTRASPATRRQTPQIPKHPRPTPRTRTPRQTMPPLPLSRQKPPWLQPSHQELPRQTMPPLPLSRQILPQPRPHMSEPQSVRRRQASPVPPVHNPATAALPTRESLLAHSPPVVRGSSCSPGCGRTKSRWSARWPSRPSCSSPPARRR